MGLNRQIQSAGSLGLFDITDDLVIRLVVEGAGASNAIVVRGRIKGQSAFNTLQTVTGSTSTTVTVATYEEIEIDCTVYNTTSTEVKVIVTSFDQDISSATVSAGAATEAKQDTGNTSLASIDAKTPALVGGKVPVDISSISGTVEITNDVGNAIPVSAASLPLPSGASTEAKQDTQVNKLSSIDDKTPALVSGKVPVDVGTPSVTVNNGVGSPVPVSAASLPLPAGAATSANQSTANSSLSSLDGKVPANLTVTSTRLLVDNSGVTQPISASALPLPSGAATSANQSTANSSLSSIDGKLPALTGLGRVPVDIGGNGSITVTSGTITVSNEVEVKNDAGNPVPVSATSLPLPTGAATETTLSGINGKLGSLGQKTMANSAPVVIASDQSAIPASQSGTWNITNISGTVSLPTGAATAAAQTSGNTSLTNIAGATLVDNAGFLDGTTRVSVQGFILDETAGIALTENDAAAARIDSKRAQVLVIEDATTRGRRAAVTAAGAIQTDSSATTQPISATALPLPTNASTSALQTTGNTSLSSIDTKLPSNLTVTSTRLLVDNSGVTQPVSAASLPLPSGAATESTLSGMSGKLPATLGQKTSANSLSVVVASDQSPLPISGTITSTQVAGVEDATNSSTSPLLANGVFTGTAFNVTGYVAINVNVRSDVASATGGVRVEFSPDGTNWDHSHSTTYTAATGVGYIFNVEYKFARVVYTNGATPQTFFRLQTIFKSTLTKSSLYTLSQAINSNMFAELGRSVITGETTAGGGGYVNVKVDPSGAMITATTIDTALPAGDNNIGNVDVVTLPVSYNAGVTDAQTQRVVVANDQTLPISAASLPLPTGAATSALQTTGNSAITALSAKTGASMVTVAHDEVVVTYVSTSNRISTVVYKLATATVATLTFSYDGSNRLTGVVRS
jgi:hypothetical protein